MSKQQKINDLHEQAMTLAEEVYIAQRKKDTQAVKKWTKQSFELEKAAAMLLVNDFELEPTRSVLFKGAACLAINAALYREAERMIGFGLSGNPPVEIAEELRVLLTDMNAQKKTSASSKLLQGQLLSNQISRLPKELQQTVKDFVDFLLQKQSKRA